MKNFYYTLLVFILTLPVLAQENRYRIAVFDPISTGTSIDAGTKIAIREIISSTVVNADKYDIVERSLLEKVIEEQSFSNSGIVDENQATEIGKLAGANKIIVSILSSTNKKNIFSIKLIDVKTANIERQQVKVFSSDELLDIIEPMTLDLIEAKKQPNNNTTETSKYGYFSKYKKYDYLNDSKNITSGMRYKDYKKYYNARDYKYKPGDNYNPALSGICSFFIPGLGQIINGELGRGFAWLGGITIAYTMVTVPQADFTSLKLGEKLGLQNGYGWYNQKGKIVRNFGIAFVVGISILSCIDGIKVAKIKNMYIRDLRKTTSLELNLKPYLTNTTNNSLLNNTSYGLSLNITF